MQYFLTFSIIATFWQTLVQQKTNSEQHRYFITASTLHRNLINQKFVHNQLRILSTSLGGCNMTTYIQGDQQMRINYSEL